VNGLHVVLDSTANVPAELLAAHANLHVVPLTVTIGTRQWPEGELTVADLFGLVESTKLHPKTSQPAPGDFAQVLAPLVQAGCPVLVITLCGGLSGTLQSARTAVRLVGDRQVWVIDSGTTAIGMVKMAQAALYQAQAGVSPAGVVELVAAMAQATRTMFVPDTLEYLHKGGRIGGAAALLGTVLQIRPVLYLADGRVEVLDKVRTRQRAIDRMVEELKTCRDPAYIGVVHIEAAAEAARLQGSLQMLYPDTTVTVSTAGAVLGAHLGPGLLGLIYQKSLAAGRE
jgi:DegV family protein with EDD domain